MKRGSWAFVILLGLAAGLMLVACTTRQSDTIRIGINAPLIGDFPKVGECTKFAAQSQDNPGPSLCVPGCFLDQFQGKILANFIKEEFGFTRAAVLYDVASDYPKGLAEFFKKSWEGLNGPGSVAAYESFVTIRCPSSRTLSTPCSGEAFMP